jgi:FMN phosphatase YigB (HAD superfamily)
MIKRLIFDIDGTLITGVSFDKAITNSLLEQGIFSEENKKKFIYSISTYENYHKEYEQNQYLQYFSQNLGCNLDKNFLDIFFRNLGIYAIPDDNQVLIETIDQLSRKYELVLLSNYFEKSQRERLKHIGIDKYFSKYYGEKVCKPHKQAYLDAIRNT